MMKKLLAAAISAVAITTLFCCFMQMLPRKPKQSMDIQPRKDKKGCFGLMYVLPKNLMLAIYKDAVNIPHDKIVEGVKAIGSDKDAPINLYCRSGRRAEAALTELKNAGYTNVTNHGGYEDLVKKGLK